MAQDRTAGFDLMVQISENEINAQLALAFAAGLVIPQSLAIPFDAFGASGMLDLNLHTPVADLDRPPPRLGLTVPFSGAQLDLQSPLPLVVGPLAGSIVVVDALQVHSSGGTQQVVLDFQDGMPSVTVSFDAASAATLAPLLATLGVSLTTAQNQVAELVRSHLATQVQRMPLTPAIPVADDSDPLTPFRIEATTVNDSSAADRDALVFGIRTDASSGGNINALTQSFIPTGSPAVLMMSNVWLLARVVRPVLVQKLGLQLSDVDTPLHLNHPVPAPGGQGTLTQLDARVEGNRIRCDGQATASGTGWSAHATFSFFVDLSLSGGQLVINVSTPAVHTDISLEWWVVLLSLGLGGLFGGIVGLIVGAIVPAIAESIAEGMADKMLSDAFNSATGSIPPVPLGPVGSGLTMSSILLDDLELRGPVARNAQLPIKSQGQLSLTGGLCLDLDSGHTYPLASTRASIDLAWNPAAGLDTRNQAGLSITGSSYGALSPLQLASLGFGLHHLAAGAIPLSLDFWPFGSHQEVVMGVRTNEGRLAKLRAWRDVLQNGALQLHWTTYDTPIPALDIATRWSIIERGEGTPVPGKDFAMCVRSPVSRRCVVEAWPKLVAFPVNYQWCLCGQVLSEAEGEVSHAGGTVHYSLQGRFLTLETKTGEGLDCELCVSAIDHRGRELFTCVRLQQDATDTVCGPGRRFYPAVDLDLVPCDPLHAIATYEPVGGAVMQAHWQRAVAAGHSGLDDKALGLSRLA